MLRITATITIALLTIASPSLQAAEAESAMIFGAGYRMLDLSGRNPVHLGGLSAGMEWGLSDFWNLQAMLSGSGGGALDGTAAAGGEVGLQISTLIDATQWIPYLAAGVRGGIIDVGIDRNIDPYVEIYGGGGIDFRPRREWSVGLFGFGGVSWCSNGFGPAAGALFTVKLFIPHIFE